MSIAIFDDTIIEKTYNQYMIKLIPKFDQINIQILDNFSFYIYESTFFIKKFQNFFPSNISISQISEKIKDLIEQKYLKIEENKSDLKLNLFFNDSSLELILNKKDISSIELFTKLINEINKIKNENNLLKENYYKLNERIELIEKKENDILKNENYKINEIKKRIKRLENFHKEKSKLTECNLYEIKEIKPHNDTITVLSTFPSGNIITTSKDNLIKIYDKDFNLIDNISNKHIQPISHIEIKDENNFISCSHDKNIKLWIKRKNHFINNNTILNAHEEGITKVIYLSNKILISCSKDCTIKIWEENNKNIYDNIVTLTHFDNIYSILFLEDKNILISSGKDGTKFWNLNKNQIDNINCIIHFETTKCLFHTSLCRLDEDRIIVNGKNESLKVISISKNSIIKEINNPFLCSGILVIEDKEIFIVGGQSKDIKIYRNDNYECIQTIRNAHDFNILGFIELKNGSIASYSVNKIKIWDM